MLHFLRKKNKKKILGKNCDFSKILYSKYLRGFIKFMMNNALRANQHNNKKEIVRKKGS